MRISARACARRAVRLQLEGLESRDLPTNLVMPLGASITAGYPQGHGGYRVPLLSMLSSGGINITYVGSQTTYNPPDQPNLHHEGHPGFLIADVDGLVQNGIIQQYNPDTILLYIGTNNLDLNENTPWIPTVPPNANVAGTGIRSFNRSSAASSCRARVLRLMPRTLAASCLSIPSKYTRATTSRCVRDSLASATASTS